jgi:hypothetical protein
LRKSGKGDNHHQVRTKRSDLIFEKGSAVPLNQQLFELLNNEFYKKRGTPVKIYHPGERMLSIVTPSPISGRKELVISAAGEEYAVNCPFCTDTKRRLVINHRWGFDDPETGRNLHLCHCFNETLCMSRAENRYALYKLVFEFKNVGQRGTYYKAGIFEGSEPEQLGPVRLPGTCYPLTDCDLNSRPLIFLRGRAYDPVILSNKFGLTYCAEAEDCFHTAAGRIIIPIKMDGALVGWQGRVPIEQKKWEYQPKYYNFPGMRKSAMLYNMDNARQLKCAVLSEGPLDVWRIGDAGIAVFGNKPSPQQATLITKYWGDGLVVIAFDGDDAGRVGTEAALQTFDGRIANVVPVTLGEGKSPSNYTKDGFWDLVRGACYTKNIDLDDFMQERVDGNFEAQQRTADGAARAG